MELERAGFAFISQFLHALGQNKCFSPHTREGLFHTDLTVLHGANAEIANPVANDINQIVVAALRSLQVPVATLCKKSTSERKKASSSYLPLPPALHIRHS